MKARVLAVVAAVSVASFLSVRAQTNAPLAVPPGGVNENPPPGVPDGARVPPAPKGEYFSGTTTPKRHHMRTPRPPARKTPMAMAPRAVA